MVRVEGEIFLGSPRFEYGDLREDLRKTLERVEEGDVFCIKPVSYSDPKQDERVSGGFKGEKVILKCRRNAGKKIELTDLPLEVTEEMGFSHHEFCLSHFEFDLKWVVKEGGELIYSEN